MDSHEPKDPPSGSSRWSWRGFVGVALLFSAVLAIPALWPPLPVPAIYVLFGLTLVGIGTFLFANARSSAQRGAQLGIFAAAIATAMTFSIRGRNGLGLVVFDSLRSEPHDLQRFGYTFIGFVLTVIGLVCFCGLLVGACRTLFFGKMLIGAMTVLLLCYWVFCWHQMAHAFRVLGLERRGNADHQRTIEQYPKSTEEVRQRDNTAKMA